MNNPTVTITRRVGQSVLIGNDIVVTVTRSDRGKIRLGVTAPRNVLILRTELLSGSAEGDSPIALKLRKECQPCPTGGRMSGPAGSLGSSAEHWDGPQGG